MKRSLILILALALCISLCACGSPAPAAAPAVFEDTASEPETPPIREVTITTENFFDYFEYVEFPENSKSVYIDSVGVLNNIRFDSGYYLKDGFVVAEEKQQDCAVEVGVKWKVQQFYRNKGIMVDLEAHSYEATGDPRFTYKFDEMKEGTVFRPEQDDPLSYHISFYRTNLGNGNGNDTYIIIEVNFVSASGTLYLYE